MNNLVLIFLLLRTLLKACTVICLWYLLIDPPAQSEETNKSVLIHNYSWNDFPALASLFGGKTCFVGFFNQILNNEETNNAPHTVVAIARLFHFSLKESTAISLVNLRTKPIRFSLSRSNTFIMAKKKAAEEESNNKESIFGKAIIQMLGR
jgi:hypothetical protein